MLNKFKEIRFTLSNQTYQILFGSFWWFSFNFQRHFAFCKNKNYFNTTPRIFLSNNHNVQNGFPSTLLKITNNKLIARHEDISDCFLKLEIPNDSARSVVQKEVSTRLGAVLHENPPCFVTREQKLRRHFETCQEGYFQEHEEGLKTNLAY